jgi:uncharacterized membrane protein
MKSGWEQVLQRWTGAGLLDDEAEQRIRAWEADREQVARMPWTQILGMTFGAILLTAGIVLFIRGQWDYLSIPAQTALTVLLVSIFHLAGGAVAARNRTLAMILHGIGTIALGAGVSLIADVYQVHGHWSGAMLVWTVGSAIAWVLLRDWIQVALFACIAPLWLVAEWEEAVRSARIWPAQAISGAGLFLLSLTYLSGRRFDDDRAERRALAWIGGLTLIPAALILASASSRGGTWLDAVLQVPGWTVAIAVPLCIAFALRRDALLPNVAAAIGTVLIALSTLADRTPLPYAAVAANAVGLVAWGVLEKRPERINLGIAGFAITVAAFFSSDIMDRLGRATGLIILGIVFLCGGWYLERIRRRLISRTRGGQP